MRILVAIASFSLPLLAGPFYTIHAVGPQNSVATGIGSDGSVSGYSTDYQGTRSAFRFDGVTSVFQAAAAAYDTNANGITAGSVWTAGGERAAVWNGSAVSILDLTDSYALAVSESGLISGSAVRDGGTRGFVMGSGGLSWIDAGVWSAAYDVNDQGQAAGTFQDSGGRFRAFLWTGATGVLNLGTLGGNSSWAQAVNEFGAAAGSSTTGAGYLHAFVYTDRMIDLGTLGSTISAAYDVNGHGHVVGYSYDREGRSRAFIWRDGVMFDLNELVVPDAGWRLEAAYGINDSGQIAGTGWWNGQAQAFLLQPSGPQVAADLSMTHVPEPAGLAGVVIACLTVGAIRLMKH